MIYGSLCSGIEAATQAWHPLGWRPAFFSEIDAFPSAVLAHHYGSNLPGEAPSGNGVPNYGDMTRFQEWPDHAVDLLVGGTPCQSFSVAGLRKGLADPRGNLMLTFGAVAQKYRPRWILWENVPGVLSSHGGRDFGTFLGMLAELGYGFAYRVLDAQFVRTRRFPGAVPQRRRRVFVVGYLGDWRRAAAVLFDRESLRGDPPPRREAGQRPARGFECGPSGGSFTDVAPTLDTGCKDGPIRNQIGVGVVSLAHGQGGAEIAHDHGPTLTRNHEAPIVAHALRAEGFDAGEDGTGRQNLVPVAIQERAICENPNAGPDGAGFRQDGAAYTLEARTVPQAVAFDCKGTQVQWSDDGSHPTMRAMGHGDSHANAGGQLAVAVAPLNTQMGLRGPGTSNSAREGVGIGDIGDPAFSLQAAHGHAVITPWAVRRLTPRECERLQGFPDGFTRIPYRGKPADRCPDGPRYKALGNSMAVNVMAWIGERIALVDAMEAAE